MEYRAKNHDLGEMLLVGDMYARTAGINSVFEESDIDVDNDLGTIETTSSNSEQHAVRSSKGTLVNTRGKLFKPPCLQ